jgi:NADH dehydrogenase (ubiquinone) 1 alpha/beta subcomplex 1
MFSAARLVASRVATRATSHAILGALRPPPPSLAYTMRHFSAPPAFLDPAEVLDRIVTVVKNFDQVDPAKVNPAVKFADDLGLDSLDIVEVVMAIEDEFAIEIPDQEADKMSSITDAVEYISTHPMAK